ncbi:MAG: ATP-binding cassette domain-containing protein, partial [Clostridiales bacterium]|nr:ATP-binding cassette domain-containing protein [Clostridiales bacterium]
GPEPSGNEILSVRGLKKSFNGRTVFENVSFLIWKGQTVCLIGANGCGKSTLLKILVDKEQADDGIYTIGAGVRLGYFEQNLDGLNTDNTILEEMQDAFPRLLEGEIRNYLGAFLFRGDDIYKNIGNLSGGERARIKLLKLVLGGANVLLLDEPTNHFDIQSCEVLEKALESFEGTVLIVTHDRYLVRRMADRVLYLSRNGIQELEEQEGEDIFSLVKAPEPAHAQETTEKKQKENFYKQQKQSRIALAAARQQAARCEKAIMENELQCNQLQADMETAQQRGEYSRIQEFCARLEQLQKESDCLYEKLKQAENELATLEEQMEQNG